MNCDNIEEHLFRFKYFSLINSVEGLKVGTDGVLLGAWCDLAPGASCWDVGTGTGIIALMLAQRGASSVVGFEIEPKACEIASRNALNVPGGARVDIVAGDALIVSHEVDSPQLIVSNPPFFKEDASLAPKGEARGLARRASSLSVESLIRLASDRLSADGSLAFIAPCNMNDEVYWLSSVHRLVPRRVTLVRSNERKAPFRTLWQLSRIEGPCECNELCIRRGAGYSAEYINLTKDFYLDF